MIKHTRKSRQVRIACRVCVSSQFDVRCLSPGHSAYAAGCLGFELLRRITFQKMRTCRGLRVKQIFDIIEAGRGKNQDKTDWQTHGEKEKTCTSKKRIDTLTTTSTSTTSTTYQEKTERNVHKTRQTGVHTERRQSYVPQDKKMERTEGKIYLQAHKT